MRYPSPHSGERLAGRQRRSGVGIVRPAFAAAALEHPVAGQHLAGADVQQHRGAEREHAYAFEDRNFGGDCVYLLQRHVVQHLQGGAPLENDAASYLRNIVIEEAVYRSAEEGRWVAIAPEGRQP